MGRWTFKLVAFLAVVAGFFAAVIVLGHMALDYLRQHDRYTLEFSQIECEPPPGMDRPDFLDEVQYLASLPTRLGLLDPDLRERLADGFGRHPWVERVREVVISPRQVSVRCQYRQPVLAVRLQGVLRAVDRQGVLLPPQAPTAGLPEYAGKAPAPKGPAGTRWGDPRVEAAAANAPAKKHGGGDAARQGEGNGVQ